MRKKRVLILYADAGFGHRSAARAVQSALRERYSDQVEALLVNPMDDPRTPPLLRDSQSDYDRVLQTIPELYRIGYGVSDAGLPTTLLETALILMMFDPFKDMVSKYAPDAILTTYPLYQAPLDAVFTFNRISIPLLAAVTDLASVHRLWFNPSIDRCLVPTPAVEKLARLAGLAEENIQITGIPVNPAIKKETRTREELRAFLGWQPHLPTILTAGSKRLGGMMDSLHVINHSGFPIQLVPVAGGDDDLYQTYQSTDWHMPVRTYNFVENMNQFMLASDMLICKAGGLIVSEAMACGLPMLLVDVLPGQEAGNAEYVVCGGAGALVPDPVALLETLSHWLMDDRKELAEVARNARDLGKPEAAYTVAEEVLKAALRGPVQHKHLLDRTGLLKLLRQFRAQLRDWEKKHLGNL